MADVTAHHGYERGGDAIHPSEGGPNRTGWIRVASPPPLELPCDGGTYVLDDGPDGPRYVFVGDG